MTLPLDQRTTTHGGVSAFARPITYRGDIEGLRAVAVLLVLIDHAGLPLTGGFVGVDVFFVISGFLITSLLLSELVGTRRVSLRAFYARRARRLLPGAIAVLVATGLLTVLFVPRTRWVDIGYDTLASALYAENWRLAGLAVDYQAQDVAASPLQHFWSLAVEEQFYLLWPLLLVAVAALIRAGALGRVRRGSLTRAGATVQRRIVVTLVAVIGVVAAGSLGWSVWFTDVNPAGAYFVTTTRLWELALGGLVALSVGRLATLPATWAAVLGWTGLAAVAVCAVLYSGSTPFPGVAALGPVLGTAAVLAAGSAGAPAGPMTVLDTAPMRWVGKLSYSLYLWHWPLLIVAATVVGSRSAGLGAAVVALSFVPAYLSFRYVENPVRSSDRLRRDPEKSLAVGVVCMATGAAVGLALVFSIGPTPAPATPIAVSLDVGGAAQDAPRTGAMVLADNPRDDPAGAPTPSVPSITPDPLVARTDIGENFCGATLLDTAIASCVGGDPASPIEVALIGDSHAQQWTTPLSIIAEQRHWKLVSYTKAACPFTAQDVVISSDDQGPRPAARPYSECSAWRDAVVDRITGPAPPAMIIVSSGEHLATVGGRVVAGQESTDLLARGFRDIWSRVQARGTRVVVLADTPAANIPVPDCVASNPDDLTECTVAREDANAADGSALVAAARAQPDVTLIDLSDAICPTERCAPVIGGVMVWRDGNHVSATYAATLAPRLNRLLPPVP